MTDSSTQEAFPLPGIPDPGRLVSDLEDQTRRSLRYLVENELVDSRHAGLMQLALELARSINPAGKAYGNAQAAAQLLAVWDKLLPDDEGGDGSGFDELRAYLAGVDAGRSTT